MYVCIMTQIENWLSEYGTKWLSEFTPRKKHHRIQIEYLEKYGFKFDDNAIADNAPNHIEYHYNQGVICYKHYPKQALPSNKEIETDLKLLAEAYNDLYSFKVTKIMMMVAASSI